MSESEMIRHLYLQFKALGANALFQLISIPAALYFFGVVAKGIAYDSRIKEGTLSGQERYNIGIEFCLMASGLYWRAAYVTSQLTIATGIFAFSLSFLLLMWCAWLRNRLSTRPGWDLAISNAIGTASLGLAILVLFLVTTDITKNAD